MASVIEQAPAERPTTSRYQALLVGLLGVNIGIVFLDRTAFGLLAPMIQPEFRLDQHRYRPGQRGAGGDLVAGELLAAPRRRPDRQEASCCWSRRR